MADGQLHCSFCSLPRAEVRFMMTGPTVAICGDCIALGVRMLAEGEGFFRQIEGDVPLTLIAGEQPEASHG